MAFLKTIDDSHFTEHHCWPYGELIPENVMPILPEPIHFLNEKDNFCVLVKEDRTLHTGYYIGIDWINQEKTIYVEPKLNKNSQQTNYLQMLFQALRNPEIAPYASTLFEIKWDKEQIEIDTEQDLLTPLLVVQYLQLVRKIVRKGLKKSYYKIEKNLYGRVHGKILVGQSIKQNLLKNRQLYTFCSFDEFGFNNSENRLLKKALSFIQRYLPTMRHLKAEKFTTEIFNYINPAFENISEEIEINEVKSAKFNIFYKEYAEAIRLAKLILKRFGYNISNTQSSGVIKTPPFWIDMSKLFELYVLSLLKEKFKVLGEVKYHFSSYWNELDYLLNTADYKMVADAKYKRYGEQRVSNEDVRQVSGYARLKSVYAELNKPENEIIDCLIIHPDQKEGHESFKSVDFREMKNQIEEFVQVYKVGVKLPVL